MYRDTANKIVVVMIRIAVVRFALTDFKNSWSRYKPQDVRRRATDARPPDAGPRKLSVSFMTAPSLA
jgi:hypothetical protein